MVVTAGVVVVAAGVVVVAAGVVVVAAGVVVDAAGVVVVAAGVVVLAADQLHNNECHTTYLSFIISCVRTLKSNCTQLNKIQALATEVVVESLQCRMRSR